MREVQDLVGIAPWTFIAQICNLFIQMYLIKRFLFKPINAVLQKRKEMADAQLTDARKSKEEAEAMKAEYEQNMAQAKAEASEILKDAQKSAQTKGRGNPSGCSGSGSRHQGEGGGRYCSGAQEGSWRSEE